MCQIRVWIVVMGVLIAQNIVWGQYSGGTGTVDDPWIIATAHDLSTLTGNTGHWGDAFVQSEIIDMTTENPITPIGTSDAPFTGSYDGVGNSIDNVLVLGVTQEQPGGDGLFGVVQGAVGVVTIENLSLNTPTVIGASPDTGGLIGRIDRGTVQNCHVRGGCISGTETVGGLIGHVLDSAVIVRCYATTSVLGAENVGGLIGWNTGTVEDCYCKQHMIAQWGLSSTDSTNPALGGLVGYNFTGRIASCYTDCDKILSTSSQETPSDVGGLVGRWVLGQDSILLGPLNYSNQETSGLPTTSNNAIGSPANTDMKAWSNLIAISVPQSMLQLKSTFKNWDFEYVWTIAEGNSPELR